MHKRMTIENHNIKEIRIAGILDQTSSFCFRYECRFLELDIVDYIEKLEEFKPQILFIESAWHGLSNHWNKKVYNLCFEIREIINWCNENMVPTVFWNNEDPVHFDTFLGIASLCDWVYTTDMDCVPLYKELLKHERVGVLPFGACPWRFNPIEKYERKEKACFAGGWYAFQKERCEDLKKIFDLCKDFFEIDIYEENADSDNPDYVFPEEYRNSIIGSIPMQRIDFPYKGYTIGIVMNTIKQSSTMETRRIFELLSCNTVSLSNPCTAIKKLLGDLVIVWEDEKQFKLELGKIKNVPYYKEKLRLAALRKVMLQHTYEDRLKKICEDVLGWESQDNNPTICIFSCVETICDAKRILHSWKRQKYPSELVLVVENMEYFEKMGNVKLVPKQQFHSIVDWYEADFYCYFSPDNYYGANYLTDFAAATKYVSHPVIGKGSYFRYVGGKYLLENRNLSYSSVNCLKGDRCMMKRHVAEYFSKSGVSMESILIEGFVGASIDFMNFCEGQYAETCEIAEDLDIREGYSIKEIYDICRQFPSQKCFTIQERWTGKDFLQEAFLIDEKIEGLEFPEGWYGVYTFINQNERISTQLTRAFSVEKYNSEGFIRLFLSGCVKGGVQVYLQFLDEKGKVVRKVCHTVGLYLRVPVPERAVSFYYTITMDGDSYLLLREVVINAFPEKILI